MLVGSGFSKDFDKISQNVFDAQMGVCALHDDM